MKKVSSSLIIFLERTYNMKKAFSLTLLGILSLFIGGCATLTYSGEDYNQNNLQTVKTTEDLVFNTYKKTLGNANIKMGISKTPVPEILALYVQIENLSYETPYTFRVEDLHLSNDVTQLQFITSDNYLSIYNNQEASSMAAMGAMSATLTNMTGMTANMNEFNQSMIQNSAQESNKSAFSRLEEVGVQISRHSIKHSSTISPRRSQYFYFFFEDMDSFPVYVNYKGLKYQFSL